MSDLKTRLRQSGQADNGTHYGPVWYRNPDGPEAARLIEELEADVVRLTRERDDLAKALRSALGGLDSFWFTTQTGRATVAAARAALSILPTPRDSEVDSEVT